MTGIDSVSGSGSGSSGPRQRVLYGRRMGRALRPHRQALVNNLLPSVEIVVPGTGGPLPPHMQFREPYGDYWLEIGFGAGEHLAWQARTNPQIGIIGCEPYLNGVARLLAEIDAGDLTNVRIFRDDARFLLTALPEASISRIFILFPDPWPKSRHHKRRILGPSTIGEMARILADEAELRIATDDSGYKEWILRYVLASGDFDWLARGPGDWRHRPDDWPPTRYEQKAINVGRRCTFFRFTRRPRAF